MRDEAIRAPLPVLAMLALVLAAGGIALLAGAGSRESAAEYAPIEHVAQNAGCRVDEFDGRTNHNPPTSGRFSERDRIADGSHAGRPPPSLAATIHALYHGRVLIQYRPDLSSREVARLHRLVSSDTDRVLLFANQTGMRAKVAATAYLSLMTCRRVDADTLRALRIYRDRRRGFGQSF